MGCGLRWPLTAPAWGAALWWSTYLVWKLCQNTRIREVYDLNSSQKLLLILTEGESCLCALTGNDIFVPHLSLSHLQRQRDVAGKGEDFLDGAPSCPDWPHHSFFLPWSGPRILQGCCYLPAADLGSSREGFCFFLKLWVRWGFFVVCLVGLFCCWFLGVVFFFWWLLLPLAQDFLASAHGELALNGKCNWIHCKLAVKLTEGRWSF